MKKVIALLLLGLFAGNVAYAAEEGVVQKVGDGIKKGVDATERGVNKAVEATKKGVKKGAAATGEGLQKAGQWIEEKADAGDKK
jgi:hypothetical protein